jgi:5-methylcytosine-specific restriction endonuclease McrA
MLMASVLAAAAPALGKGSSSSGHSHSGSTHHSSATHSHTGHHSSNYAAGVPRDSHGRIKRSEHAKNEFKHGNPCPSTGKSSGACPGYVVDHVVPLKRGGADKPDNMQWQTVEAAKAKDRVE